MYSTGKIFYSEEGNSTNSLICLHGIGGDDKSFEPQLKNLSSKYRVVSWNMPGYKGSKTLENYSFEIQRPSESLQPGNRARETRPESTIKGFTVCSPPRPSL